MTDPYLDAVFGLGHLVAGRLDRPLDWRDPHLLGWSNLLATAVWPALDDAVRERHAADLEGFAVAHALNTDRNTNLSIQLEAVVTRLNAAGIEPIVFKGAAHLATELWPTSGSRLISDIDIIVDARELDPAFSALETLAGIGEQDRGHPEIIALNKHMLPVLGAGGDAAVELHHTVYQGASARLAPPADLRARALPIQLGTGHARILSPTDRVLTAMMHGLLGSGAYLVPALHMRDLLDIHFLDAKYGAQIDWALIQDHVTSNRWAVALDITNTSLERFTGMTPPFSKAGGALTRLDAARWRWQLESGNPIAMRAGAAANHTAYTLQTLRAGGEPRRRALRNFLRPETYRLVFRRYVLGREE